MKKKQLFIVFIVVAVAITCLSYSKVNAQNHSSAKSDSMRISLADAEQRFVTQNLAIMAAKYSVDIAKANVLQSKLWYNPNINYSQGLFDPQSKKYFDYTTSGEYDWQLHQLISIAGKHSNLVKLNKIDEQRTELAFNELLRSLKFSLYTSYSSLYAAQQREKLYQYEIQNLKLLVEAAQQQFKLGSIAGNEVVRLKTELQDTKNDEINAEQELYDAEKDLKILLNVDYNTSLIASDLPTYSSAPPTLEQALTAAEQNRPDLLIAQKTIDYQHQNLKLQRSSAIPDLTLGTEFDRASTYVRNYYGIGASMDLPIFNRNQAQIKIAKYELSQAQVLDTLQLNTVKSEVVGAYSKMLRLKSELNSIDSKYDSSLEDLVDYALKNYNKRYISLLEFLDQMRTYTQAKLSLIDINSDHFNSIQYLNYTTGTSIIK